MSPGVLSTLFIGRQLDMAPSIRRESLYSTGLNNVGIDMDALIAEKRSPLEKTTSSPVYRSVATAL